MKENVIRQLPVLSTQDEFDQRAAELAAVAMEIEELHLAQKAAVSEFKGEIEDAQTRFHRLVGVVAKRSEIRDTNCTEHLNADKKLVELIRTDTGEIVETRGVTGADLQGNISIFDASKRKAKGE